MDAPDGAAQKNAAAQQPVPGVAADAFGDRHRVCPRAALERHTTVPPRPTPTTHRHREHSSPRMITR
ncbi:hypothetical protein GCM10022254_62960 [Actinomadura meridiana]|uniref:Uncharacterized protein n=1 Tax=Actinomadura meridiana TaxID=559626 RepID=A0ABP8CJE8_9ACTN